MGIIEELDKRVAALESRCHELEHSRAKVGPVSAMIADLQERVGSLEAQRSQVPYILVDDHRDTERPVSPVAAIPDVPTPVGTEAFRRELQRHGEELGHAYLWLVHSGQCPRPEHIEHLAGVACTLRDAYELARCGEQEQADEKLKEIVW